METYFPSTAWRIRTRKCFKKFMLHLPAQNRTDCCYCGKYHKNSSSIQFNFATVGCTLPKFASFNMDHLFSFSNGQGNSQQMNTARCLSLKSFERHSKWTFVEWRSDKVWNLSSWNYLLLAQMVDTCYGQKKSVQDRFISN